MSKRIENILWSIAFPGFGQFLNNHLFKGTFFILLEFIINYKAKTNMSILYSFYGNTELAIKEINYQWLMFYPCIYLFAMWDAYKNAEPDTPVFAYIPFVSATYLGTIGVIYSPTVKVFGFLLGPVFLPIISIGIGVILGLIIRLVIVKYLPG
ncbi:MAG: hypothetical protein K0R54_5080 [Clostridiaceae bacterium]|jgi:hypothetical protein|nr:hypothetical protein [Clostridiaceae bacterium]